jgi:hypothetical protein
MGLFRPGASPTGTQSARSGQHACSIHAIGRVDEEMDPSLYEIAISNDDFERFRPDLVV